MPTAYSSIQACALRAVKLDDDGTPLDGTDSSYTTQSFMTIDHALTVSEGEEFELKNACGGVVATAKDCDRITGTEGEITLGHLDPELVWIMAGGTILHTGGAVVGYSAPGLDDPCEAGFSLEVWTKAWDGNQQAVEAGDALYWRFVWPRVVGRPGDFTLEAGILELPIPWNGNPNSALVALRGPDADWPLDTPLGTPWFYFKDDTLPAINDGALPYPLVS